MKLSGRLNVLATGVVACCFVVFAGLAAFDRVPLQDVVNSAERISGQDRKPRERNAVTVRDPMHPCSVVCVVAAAQMLGRPVTLDEARQALRPDPRGMNTLSEISGAFKSFGLSSIGLRLSCAELRRIRSPVVLHLTDGHFVVVEAGEGQSVLLLDPPRPLSVASCESIEGWEGDCLLVTSSTEDLSHLLASIGLPL